jgi:hypothetical protein
MFVTIAIAWAFFLSPPARALTDCTAQYLDWQDQKKKDQSVAANATALRASLAAIKTCEQARTASVGDCNEAKTDYTSSISDFQNKCRDAGLPTSPDSGAIACSTQADPMSTDEGRNACACSQKKISPTDNAVLKCKSSYDPKLLSQCPNLNDAAADRQQHQIERLEDQINKIKDKQDKNQDTSGQTADKASEKAAQARHDKAAADKEYYQAVQQANKAASDAQQQMIQSMNAMQEKIFGVQQKLTDSRMQDAQSYTAFRKQQIEIELNCTNQATQAVNAMATEAIGHLKDGTYNRGSQNDLFKQVGLTDRQSWQQQAAIRKKWCMDSESTHDSQASAQMAYQDSLKAQAAARQQAYDEISMYNSQLAQIQTSNGSCSAKGASGAMVQTQACKDLSDKADSLKLASKLRQSAYKQANADKDDATAAAQRAKDVADGRSKKDDAELNDLQTQLKALKDAQTIGATYPNSGGRDPQVRALNITMEKLMAQAGRATACCKKSRQTASPEDSCSQAKHFLESRGFDTAAVADGRGAPNPPNPPNPPPDPASPGGAVRDIPPPNP